MSGGVLHRIVQASDAGAAQTLSVKANYGAAGVVIISADVNWSAVVASVQHKVVRDGGHASYNTIFYDETLSLTDWVWYPDFPLLVFRKGVDGAELDDEMDFVIGAGGGAIVSRLTVILEVI